MRARLPITSNVCLVAFIRTALLPSVCLSKGTLSSCRAKPLKPYMRAGFHLPVPTESNGAHAQTTPTLRAPHWKATQEGATLAWSLHSQRPTSLAPSPSPSPYSRYPLTGPAHCDALLFSQIHSFHPMLRVDFTVSPSHICTLSRSGPCLDSHFPPSAAIN